MTTAFQRLNERKQRPNSRIDFIKAIDNHPKGEDFLNRIAAQCFPVMNKAGINVRSLEEYEPNPEFLGRNFNGGEVIQLVLKDRQGRWLSLNFVQMVMMHELAHCKQMNHSRAFWAVRNEYAKQMEDIWRSGYVGEGIFGRGRDLANGSIVHNRPPDMSQVPEHLCGGTFQKRGRKRKAGNRDGDQPAKLTYAERQQRRIEKKFGKHGEGAAVGEDDLLRGALETMNGGKRRQGKPKVAKSKRGRDLCANAALARFEQAKKQPKEEEQQKPEFDDSETESEWEDDFVQVCGDEGDHDAEAGNEMDELRMLSNKPSNKGTLAPRGAPGHEDSETESEAAEDDDPTLIPPAKAAPSESEHRDNGDSTIITQDETELLHELDRTKTASENEEAENEEAATIDLTSASTSTSCPICSLENEPNSTLCVACSHVLRTSLVRDHWRCRSNTCNGSKYINPGDFGRCGLCNAPKPQASSLKHNVLGQGRAPGLTRPEVLRWD